MLKRKLALPSGLTPAAPSTCAPRKTDEGAGMTSPIYVAIDTPDMDRARAIAAAVKRHAGGLKLGSNSSVTMAGRGCSSLLSSAFRSSST
jgi:hypothetical protein